MGKDWVTRRLPVTFRHDAHMDPNACVRYSTKKKQFPVGVIMERLKCSFFFFFEIASEVSEDSK